MTGGWCRRRSGKGPCHPERSERGHEPGYVPFAPLRVTEFHARFSSPVPTQPASPTAHVLVADDQPHVREALRLLLKGEGYAIETAASPAAVLSAVQASDFDAVLLDLNYARDTTTGREGLELVSQLQALDATLPTVVMTAWGSVEKAVEAMRRGARDFIEKPWDNNRLLATLRTQVELGRALRNTQRLETREPAAPPRRGARADRAVRRHAPGAPADGPGGRLGCERAHQRRARHRQGGRGPVAPRRLAARRATARRGEPRRAVGRPVRERDVRPREGRVHRRADRPHRPVRARRGRHPPAGRDRNAGPAAAGEAAPGAGDRRGGAGGCLALPPDRRAHPVGHQRGPPGRGGRRAVPRGPALPAQHHRDPPAAAARAAGGHPAPWPSTSSAATPRATASRWSASSPRRSRRSRPTRGPATCASWTTRWSARC